MKKLFSILSYVFAGLSIVGFVTLCILNSDTTPTLWIINSLLIVLAVGMVLTSILCKNNKIVAMIPMVLVFVVTSIFNDNASGSTTSVNAFEVLSLLMLIAYIVALVFALKNDSKIAKYYVVVYVSLLLVSELSVLFSLVNVVDSLVLSSAKASELALPNNFVMTSVSAVFVILTQLVIFLASLSPNAEKAVVEEQPQEEVAEENTSNEVVEEQPQEEVAEENASNEVVEADTEETAE